MSEASVSVVIPAYRCSRTIIPVLEALLAQTVPLHEIIVVNDASPDDLEELLQPWQSRISYFRNERNCGLSKTYNVGLRAATGDYILTLHSDCVLSPDYIAKLRGTLSEDSRLGAVVGRSVFPEISALGKEERLFIALNRLPLVSRELSAVEKISFIEGKADLFRRADLERFGFFSEDLVLTGEDQDLSAKLRSSGFWLARNPAAIYTVCYNGTQDSTAKILRKQRTYARGQAMILLRYGRHAVKSTTPDRDARALHRALQVTFIFGAGMLLLLGAWRWLLAWWLLRVVYYGIMSLPLGLYCVFQAMLLGPVADFLYVLGLVEGTISSLTRRKA